MKKKDWMEYSLLWEAKVMTNLSLFKQSEKLPKSIVDHYKRGQRLLLHLFFMYCKFWVSYCICRIDNVSFSGRLLMFINWNNCTPTHKALGLYWIHFDVQLSNHPISCPKHNIYIHGRI